MANHERRRGCVELDGDHLSSIDQALKALLAIGLSISMGMRIGLLIRVRGRALKHPTSGRTLAVACRTRLPEACEIALVLETAKDFGFAEDFGVYTTMAHGAEVRVFQSNNAARAWLGNVDTHALAKSA
jgi:hypothetical protein